MADLIQKSFLDHLKNEANKTFTENGAVTWRSSGSENVDLFASIGALRSAESREIVTRFYKAWAEDRNLAMKILFYARDVRGGLGERRVFRVILQALSVLEPDSVRKNIRWIPEYGRFDDLLVLLGTPCEEDALSFIREQMTADLAALESGEPVSLMAKWLPSINASSTQTREAGKIIAKSLGMNGAQYRKTLSSLREAIRILENNLREKDYSFDYSKQPSKAMFKYRKAFDRNDTVRYQAFLAKVKTGKAVLHTGTLMPYELVHAALTPSIPKSERESLDVTWKALEDFTDGRNALAVIDGSGSMYWGGTPLPAESALALGIYFAERNTGLFHDHFITFSMSPQLVQIKGKDLVERVRYCKSFNEVADTNMEAVFDLILSTAVRNRLPQEQMPETLYIISDMEFNSCVRNANMTVFDNAKQRYAQFGYRLPKIIFWCIQSRNEQVPVKKNEQGVALVSGNSPRIFSMMIRNETDPYSFMMQVIGSERYEPITA